MIPVKFTRAKRVKLFKGILLLPLLLLSITSTAHAYYYTGSDWGGKDLTLLNGDSLSGTFSNVGQFYISTGAVISGSSGNLIVNASSFLIDGSLAGLAVPGYDLMLFAQTNFILNGSLSSWKNIWLGGSYVTISNSASIATSQNSVPYDPAAGSLTLSAGGSLSTGGSTGGNEVIGKSQEIVLGTGGSILILPINLESPAVVTPIPAAAWLFGSGLLGLVGIRKRKTF
jgi:hypothetical protein